MRIHTMHPVQKGSPTWSSQVRAGKPIKRGCTGVGTVGYWRVTGARNPVKVEARVNNIPFRLLSIAHTPCSFSCGAALGQ